MIVARENEIKQLKEAYAAKEPRFVAIYGRRRIGKTFLVRELLQDKICFSHTGIADKNMKEQLTGFMASVSDCGYDDFEKPSNWIEAFQIIKEIIKRSKARRKVIFLDELAWMDTPRSSFLPALEFFWNGWASARKDVMLIVCASSTSWIINNVIHNKGGLHNRLTDQIYLRPFYLEECERLIKQRGLALGRNQILICYMIMGGVPYYWNLLKKGKSIAQNIDAIFFDQNAPLKNEFKYLYASLFKNPERYMTLIQTLGTQKRGLSRQKIIEKAGIKNSGAVTNQLAELEECGFIRKYVEYGKKKRDAIYQLIDNFSLFHLKFIENATDEHFWMNSENTPETNIWKGLAFERVCLQHINQIKEGLGIKGVLTNVYSWECESDDEKGVYGSQIDLLIYRKDQVVNICEMKYSTKPYLLNATEYEKIQERISDFQVVENTGFAIHPIVVTPMGLKENKYSSEIQQIITMDDLFKPE